MRLSILSFVAIAAAAATPSLASAQASAKSTVLSIQPIDAMLTVYAGEAEIAMSRSVTLGVGGTYWGPDITDGDFRYVSGDLKLRYYPDSRPFQGFSFGGSVGVTHIKATDSTSQSSGSASGPSIGVMLDYNWLVGAQKAFYVGLGAGAKRVFISDKDVSDNATLIYPTLRISVGWAF
jgi:hypothetical protein